MSDVVRLPVRRPRLGRSAIRLWLPLLVVVAWWTLSARSTSIYFPPLSTILDTFVTDWMSGRGWQNIQPSLVNLAVGFAVASLLGIAVGLVLGSSRLAASAADPIVHFLRSLPPPVLLPIAFVTFGTGPSMKIAMIAFGAVWPTLLNTIDAVRGQDPQLRDTSRAFGLTRWEQVRFVTLPSAAPQILAGLRTTMQISIILIVVSEMYASTSGIGHYVLTAQQSFLVTETWAGTLMLGLVGLVCNNLFGLLERRILHWERTPALHS